MSLAVSAIVVTMTGMSRNHVLLYDHDWGFRKRSLDKILAWDRGGRLPPVPSHGEEEKRQLATMNREAPARLLAPRDARARRVLSAGAAAPSRSRGCSPAAGPLPSSSAPFRESPIASAAGLRVTGIAGRGRSASTPAAS